MKPRAFLSRVSLAAEILLVAAFFIAGLVGAINAVLQRAILEGSTTIKVEVHESSIRGLAGELAAGPAKAFSDRPADSRALVEPDMLKELEARLAEEKSRNASLEALFLADGERILASAEAGRAGTALGSGATGASAAPGSTGSAEDKGAAIKAVLASGEAEAEIEKRTDIQPRLTYLYPVKLDGKPMAVLVAKFSLAEEFAAITHLREAITRLLAIAGLVGVPALFGLLWLMAIGPLRRLTLAARRLSSGRFDLALPPQSSAELAGLSGALTAASASLKAQYERYLSPQAVALLQKEGGFLKDIRMRATASVLVADIEGFTRLSEGLDGDGLVAFLDSYFRTMTEIVFAHGGSIDKYMGDGILALFGVPLPAERFREDAILAARSMVETFIREYRGWLPAGPEASFAPMRLRVGVATGELFYGNVGYERRSDLTAIGRVVNLASRLQELNKETGTSVLADEETARGLGAVAALEPSGEIEVRGFAAPVRIHSA